MKNLFLICCLICLAFSCASDDDDNESSQEPQLTSHFEFTLDGAGFNSEQIAINRQGISVNNDRVAITAGDDNLVNFFGFYLPFPIEVTTYTMVQGSSPSENTVFLSRNQTDVYYTEDGTITITEINEGENGCQIYKGSLNVNLSLTSDTAQIVNVRGLFEMPTEECE
ncbi:hypothetical protein [uncultured Psychroserpens sp.]|uniref:hypothetical protein n=1 Tax=uncultured Psychroserpens sp. TaxID=255436 RepID=UPI00260203B3|nr:hypothetical protein [uncultured Psychroserpens sp.]